MAISSHVIPYVTLSGWLSLPENTTPPSSSSRSPALGNITSWGGFSLASKGLLQLPLLSVTGMTSDLMPNSRGSQTPSFHVGCRCSVPCPPGPLRPQKFSPAEAWKGCREDSMQSASAWSGKLKPGSQSFKVQLRSDFFTPEGEYGLRPRAPMSWPCSGL